MMTHGADPGSSDAKGRSQSVWGASPAGTTHAPEHVPGTKEFFERALKARRSTELRFLNSIPPFRSFEGKDVIEAGCGAGFDAFAFCEAGATYTGIDITPENPERSRTHLGFYGFKPRLLQADAEDLPFPDASFDVYFSNGVLHHTPDIQRSFSEAARVLRPGGEAWIILYHKNSLFYRVTLGFVQHVLLFGFTKMTLEERLARIEHTSSGELPLVRVYSRSEVRSIADRAGLRTRSLMVRKLTRDDLPNLPVLRWLWYLFPLSLLDVIGHAVGWYVILHAVKETKG